MNPPSSKPEQTDSAANPLGVTVAVCTHNRPLHLDRCLEELSRSRYSNFDVIVVDNAPGNDEAREVALRWGVRYAVEPTRGVSRARNRAAVLASTELIAYLDDDALPDKDWLAEIVAPFENPGVAAVTGRVIPWSTAEPVKVGSHVRGTSEVGTVGRDDVRTFDRQTKSWFVEAAFGGIGIGANMAFRRSAFAIAPGFDERLGPGSTLYAGEEYQLWAELIRRGKTVVYTPAAVVRHPYSPKLGEEIRKRYQLSYFGIGAYTAYLIAEYPEYATGVLAYALRRLTGGKHVRNDLRAPRPDGVPVWTALRELFRGSLTYCMHGRQALPVRERPPLLRS